MIRTMLRCVAAALAVLLLVAWGATAVLGKAPTPRRAVAPAATDSDGDRDTGPWCALYRRADRCGFLRRRNLSGADPRDAGGDAAACGPPGMGEVEGYLPGMRADRVDLAQPPGSPSGGSGAITASAPVPNLRARADGWRGVVRARLAAVSIGPRRGRPRVHGPQLARAGSPSLEASSWGNR
jgi:hypothetical protein